jgi:hypothetical protein
VSETAGDVVDAFAASEAAVEDRNPGLARRHEAAVDVTYSVFHRSHPSRRVLRLLYEISQMNAELGANASDFLNNSEVAVV